ncbi:S-layer homology domain-containing protein [Nodosilinea sp. P-1105]|uniref:S-layer homology domain-containing protein n=1 Tax=Nodosilinea sp. P-1105 TaxID=2546229 RepID=UPI00146AA954|nr:S-layer homology domain-containing protein [Nodosilinea sp. P-1105]NMF82903.1 S-layer homology domain-containing protein [Nodosilinea sp. P-1105]
MSSSSRSRVRLEEWVIIVVLLAATTAALFLIWRARYPVLNTWLNRLSLAWPREQPRPEVTDSLATALPPPQDQTALTVPPPVIPQPLLPHEAWPENPIQDSQQAMQGFNDLPSDHWAAPVVQDLTGRQMLSGFPDGSFRPAVPMTRAEFAAQLARLFDFPQSHTAPAYADVGTTYWAQASIQKSVQMGFLTGYPNDTFAPEQTITRIQVILALANGLGLRSSSGAAAVLQPYDDHDQVPDWAQRSLVAAIEAGLVVNHPDLNQLEPNRQANRAEVTAMVHRALVYTGQLQAVPLPYVVVPQAMPHSL